VGVVDWHEQSPSTAAAKGNKQENGNLMNLLDYLTRFSFSMKTGLRRVKLWFLLNTQ
jgi:hypothetical protein